MQVGHDVLRGREGPVLPGDGVGEVIAGEVDPVDGFEQLGVLGSCHAAVGISRAGP